MEQSSCDICLEEFSCDLCNDKIPYVIPCGHSFCRGCSNQLKVSVCPLCREPYDKLTLNYSLIEALKTNVDLEKKHHIIVSEKDNQHEMLNRKLIESEEKLISLKQKNTEIEEKLISSEQKNTETEEKLTTLHMELQKSNNLFDESFNKMPSSLKLKCAKCELLSTLKCGKCKKVSYCGKKCQTEDWHNHKKHCKNNRFVKNPYDIPWVAALNIYLKFIESKPESITTMQHLKLDSMISSANTLPIDMFHIKECHIFFNGCSGNEMLWNDYINLAIHDRVDNMRLHGNAMMQENKKRQNQAFEFGKCHAAWTFTHNLSTPKIEGQVMKICQILRPLGIYDEFSKGLRYCSALLKSQNASTCLELAQLTKRYTNNGNDFSKY